MRKTLGAVAALVILLASCASSPQARAPEWTLQTPAPDATNTYFVGYASAAGKDVALATEDAATNLIANIMHYIGVKVTVDSSATARATLDSYAADVTQTVKTESSNRLSGFQVKEKYVYTDKKTGKVTVYILASYVTADLEKEKRRIAAAFQEKMDAVAQPEAEGKAFLEAGRYYEAIRRFVEAAIAASGADIDNADIKLERNLNSARAALGRLRFDRLGDGYLGQLGQPFPEPFRARLVAGEGSGARGIPGAALLVSYQRRQGTRTVSKTETAVTDGTGLLSFTPPPPDFVGKAKLVVRVDFQAVADLLDALPTKWAAQRDSLQEELRSKVVEFSYQVASRAHEIPTAIAIVDLDEAGVPVAGWTAQTGLSEALAKEGFNLVPLALDPGLLAGGGNEAIQAEAASLLAGKAERFISGTARIDSVRKEGTTFLAHVQASIRVVELASGRLLYSGEKQATGLGSDEAAARRAAYRELGLTVLGKDLLASLP